MVLNHHFNDRPMPLHYQSHKEKMKMNLKLVLKNSMRHPISIRTVGFSSLMIA
jgi:hypothetical protein